MTYKKLINRISALSLLLLGAAGTAAAQDSDVSLSVEQLFVAPGETATVYVSMDNDVEIGTITGTISLPEGLSFVPTAGTDGDNQRMVCTKVGDRLGDNDMIFLSGNESKARLLITASSVIGGNSGRLFSFDVMADENIPVTSTIELSDFKGARGTESYAMEPNNGTLINANNKITASVDGFTIEEGASHAIDVCLDNNDALANIQCDVYLPEGLTLEGIEKASRLTEGENGHIISTSELAESGAVRVVIYSMGLSEISGNSGAVFTLNVTATEELADNSVIEIRNIVAASADAVGYYGEDIAADITKATTTGIDGINGNAGMQAEGIYTIGGVRTDKTNKGVNIIRKADGTTIKVYRK